MNSTNRSSDQAENSAAALLRSFAERVVRIEEDKAEITADIKSVLNEAASSGFDKNALKRIVKEMRETEVERQLRRETESLTDLYRASLGMLDGLPLGDAARKRFDAKPPPSDRDDDVRDDCDPADPFGLPPEPPTGAPPAGAMGAETIEAARDQGSAAAAAGRRVFDNPYVAGDPRRAAWDEGWCLSKGSDGMEIPEAWRRKKPPPASGDDVGEGAAS